MAKSMEYKKCLDLHSTKTKVLMLLVSSACLLHSAWISWICSSRGSRSVLKVFDVCGGPSLSIFPQSPCLLSPCTSLLSFSLLGVGFPTTKLACPKSFYTRFIFLISHPYPISLIISLFLHYHYSKFFLFSLLSNPQLPFPWPFSQVQPLNAIANPPFLF